MGPSDSGRKAGKELRRQDRLWLLDTGPNQKYLCSGQIEPSPHLLQIQMKRFLGPSAV